MHSRYWKLEFGDRDGGGVECRLLQWRDRGFEASGECGIWQQFRGDVATLNAMSLAMRSTHDAWVAAGPAGRSQKEVEHEKACATLSAALRDALPVKIQDQFDGWEDDFEGKIGEPHLVLMAAKEDTSKPSDALSLVAGCCFEGQRPFCRGAIGIRRLQVRPYAAQPAVAVPPEHQPLRVLVLVASLRDSAGWSRHEVAAIATLHSVAAACVAPDIGPAIEVVVAAAKEAAKNPSLGAIVVLANKGDLEELLRNGPRVHGQTRAYHVLVTLGHSDGTPDKEPTGLEFDFDSTKAPVLVGALQLARWCHGNLQFALLLNCKSELFAANFLASAEHVVAARPMLDVEHAELLADRLFKALVGSTAVKEVPLAEAVRKTRQELVKQHPGAGWSLVHLARREEDLEFVSRVRQIAVQLHKDAYKPEAAMCLEYGSKQQFELTRIHVSLDMGRPGDEATARGPGGDAARERPPKQAMKFADLLQEPQRRWVLRGEAGGGKTTTLRFCALDPPPGQFVLYVPLAHLARLDLGKTGESICEALARGTSYIPEVKRIANARAETGDLIVLLDAYDEVPKDLHHSAS